ncbi:hypothetical protein [Tomelloso virus]|uniref:Uncharacterized protein n=1 Tax=Tomelloso virus TaxID=2053981 RepID=A0A2H4T2R4_9VIRU|nr:hypothetical protein [Tomelloso virus]ATY70212.1 hypothetical protein [Tomelloso virus]
MRLLCLLAVALCYWQQVCTVVKTTTQFHWQNDLLFIKSDPYVVPTILQVQQRNPEWFSSTQCLLGRVDVNDVDILKITQLRVGYEDSFSMQQPKSNSTYAISNFNMNKLYFFEFPNDFEHISGEIPVYIWTYVRPPYRINVGSATKPEIMTCMHLFKLAGYAEQQVGLNSLGKPKEHADVYSSYEKYRQWVRKQNRAIVDDNIIQLDGIYVTTSPDIVTTNLNDEDLEEIIDELNSYGIWRYVTMLIFVIVSLLAVIVRFLTLRRRRKNKEANDDDDGESKFTYKKTVEDDVLDLSSAVIDTLRNTFSHGMDSVDGKTNASFENIDTDIEAEAHYEEPNKLNK